MGKSKSNLCVSVCTPGARTVVVHVEARSWPAIGAKAFHTVYPVVAIQCAAARGKGPEGGLVTRYDALVVHECGDLVVAANLLSGVKGESATFTTTCTWPAEEDEARLAERIAMTGESCVANVLDRIAGRDDGRRGDGGPRQDTAGFSAADIRSPGSGIRELVREALEEIAGINAYRKGQEPQGGTGAQRP